LGERDHLAQGEEAAEAHHAAGLDVPLHTRLLRQFSRSERECYQSALALLSSGRGLLALAREGDLPLAGLGVYEALLTRSWEVRFRDKEEMISLARAAVEVAERFESEAFGAQQVADLRARAWGELANSYRAADQLRSADRAFGRAFSFQTLGTGDPYLKARLFDLSASLLGTWRDFALAESRLRVAADLYLELGEPHLAGRAFISQALYTFYSCRPEEALRLNQQGRNLIDLRRDRSLFLMAVHNDLLFLVDMGRYAEAKRVLFDSRQHFIYQDRINALRLRGIEGRIEYGLEKLLSAEKAFRETRDGFDQAGAPFLAAIARLDLSMVLVSQDRLNEAEQEVLAARNLFKNVEAYSEFLGTMVYLEEVFRRRTVTPALIQKAIAEIWRKNLQIGPRHFR
jgi:hypothetical protein